MCWRLLILMYAKQVFAFFYFQKANPGHTEIKTKTFQIAISGIEVDTGAEVGTRYSTTDLFW